MRDPATVVHQCGQCGATYSSNSHLRRHEATHGGHRVFPCRYCKRSFVRRDVAQRHAKTCRDKGCSPPPAPEPRGRKKGSCDACAAAKTACDQKYPCGRCAQNEAVCTYRRLDKHGLFVRSDPKEHAGPGSEDGAGARVGEKRSRSLSTGSAAGTPDGREGRSGARAGRIPVPFLLNYTDPSTRSIAEFFRKPEHDETPADYEENGGEQDDATEQPRADNPDESPSAAALEMFADPYLLSNSDQAWWSEILGDLQTSTPPTSSLPSHPTHQHLERRLADLISDLESTHDSLTRQGDAPTPAFDPNTAATFFTPANAHDFIEHFFTSWTPNCPIIHRPSFDPAAVCLPLLLAALLIGAAYSNRPAAGQAKDYFDLAEAYAFEHPSFKELLSSDENATGASTMAGLDLDDVRTIEPLQAAYQMVLLQMWQSKIPARRRVRNLRYVEVIAAARRLGLPKTRNEFLSGGIGEEGGKLEKPFSWSVYIARESSIRLAGYIFGIECNFCIFHRTPPRMTIAEMGGDISCGERSWQATSASTCERACAAERRARRPPSLARCFEMLLQDALPASGYGRFGCLSAMNLFTIISAMHSAIFTSSTSCLGRYDAERFLVALDRWKVLWDARLREYNASQHPNHSGHHRHHPPHGENINGNSHGHDPDSRPNGSSPTNTHTSIPSNHAPTTPSAPLPPPSPSPSDTATDGYRGPGVGFMAAGTEFWLSAAEFWHLAIVFIKAEARGLLGRGPGGEEDRVGAVGGEDEKGEAGARGKGAGGGGWDECDVEFMGRINALLREFGDG